MRQKSPEELKDQIESTNTRYDEEDLVLSKEELKTKYQKKYEEGEVSEDAMRAYITKLKEQRKEWREKLEGIGYTRFNYNLLKKIPTVFHPKIVINLIEAGQGGSVARHLFQFKGLGQEVAVKLIEDGQDWYVARNLPQFEGLGQEMAMKLIEAGQGESVARNLTQFEGLGQEVAMKLIEAGQGESVARNLPQFEGLDQEVATKLFEAGQGESVARNLPQFEGLDHREFVIKLIEAGKAGSVARNLSQFKGLDHKEFAIKLIEAGQGWSVAENLSQFEGLDKEIVITLIDVGEGESVARNLSKSKFEGLDEEIAIKLIEIGQGWSVAENLPQFEGLDHKEIVLKLIEAGKGWSVTEYLEKFEGLDKEIAITLIGIGQGGSVARNLSQFKGLDHKEIAFKLFEAGEGGSVAENLPQFEGLDHKEIALKLIEAGKGWSVALNLFQFKGLDTEIALKLIEAGKGESIARNLSQFKGLDHKEIAFKLFEAGQGGSVARNLSQFEGLDTEIALKLIEAGKGESIARNLSQFEGLDKEIAITLIEAGEAGSVADNLEKFEGLDHKEFAIKLIEAGKGGSVARNLSQFKGLDHKEIALRLFEAGKGESVALNLFQFKGLDKEIALRLFEAGEGGVVAYYLKNFEGLDHKEVALRLFEVGKGWSVAHNLKNFEGLDHNEIASKLIEEGQGEHVARNLSQFEGLDKEIAITLIGIGQGESVARNLSQFKGLDEDIVNHVGFEILSDNGGRFEYVVEYAQEHNMKLDPFLVLLNAQYKDLCEPFMIPYLKALHPQGRFDEGYEAYREMLQEAGITQTGKAGLEQLRRLSVSLINDLEKDNFEGILGNQLKEDILILKLRIDESEWQRGLGVRELLERYQDSDHGDQEVYERKTIRVGEVGRSSEYEHTEPFLVQYEKILNQLGEAVSNVERIERGAPNEANRIVIALFEKKVQELIHQLESKKRELDNPKAAIGLDQRIQALQALRFDEISHPQELLVGLAKNKELHDELGIVLLTVGLLMAPHMKDKVRGMSVEDTSLDAVARVVEVVHHVLNKETLNPLFTDKRARTVSNDLLSVKAIEEEMIRMQDQDVIGTSEIELIHSRGFLMEVSGYLGDACWTSQASIVEGYPNMSAVIFKQNPNDGLRAKYVGAGLLLETTTEGEPLLIIRGTNPLENTINHLKVEDFVEQYIDYVWQVARSKGITRIGVVVDNASQASTNRPVIADYLQRVYRDEDARIELDNPDEVEFNGYDLSSKVYEVKI